MSQPAEYQAGDVSSVHRGTLAELLRRLGAALRPRPDDTAFMRERCAAAMEGPRYFTHWILWATLVFFLVALTWAAFAKVDEVIVGEGKVIPTRRVQVVQNLDGGIVSEIMVRVGQVVQKDEPLMHRRTKREKPRTQH